MCNNTMKLLFLIAGFTEFSVLASIGDESQYFKTCTNHCSSVKCRGGQYLRFLDAQPWWMQAMGWGCLNECHYKCTWQTVHYFSSTQQILPHFYGQYPLERVAGLREAASAVLLIISILAQIYGLARFVKNTPKSSPIRPLVLKQGLITITVCALGSVYHAKRGGDPKLNPTHFRQVVILGKFVALGVTYSILHFMYIGVYRFLWRKMPAEVRYVWRSLQLIFATYAGLCTLVLEIPPSQFFIPNAFLAVASAGLWAFFCVRHHLQLSHTWKMTCLLSVAATLFILELEDFKPLYNLMDAHAFWILGTCPLPLLWYSFAIDDSFYLYRELSAFKIE